MAETLEVRALLSSTPALVSDIYLGPDSSTPESLLAIGPTTYFTADDGIHGEELWKSDGTAAGTMMLKDIIPGGYSSYSRYLTNMNGTLFFSAHDGDGRELWKSDGTAAGTTRVKDINPSGHSSYARDLINVNGTLFFSGQDAHGWELWKSDGTAAGTTMVKDIFQGGYIGYYGGYYPNNSNPLHLTNVNGTLFFTVDFNAYNAHWRELWKSDGTASGTVMLSSVFGSQLTNVNGTLYFTANDGVHGQELWKSDGTAAGTTIVKDIFPGDASWYSPYGGYETEPNWSRPYDLTDVNGTLFFTATVGANIRSLWKSDGTVAGTVMVKDGFVFGTGLSKLKNVNGTLYFNASAGVSGNELWKSNGTAAGTAMVKDINPGSDSSSPNYLTNVNGTLYFTASDNDHGPELWKSDGTAAGTTMVMDILPGSSYLGDDGRIPRYAYFPRNLTNANGTLFFRANDGIHGTELWALNTVPAPSLGVSGFPATTIAGSAGSITITAKNADGTTNTGYLGTVHFTSTDPQAALPVDYTFTAADAGKHTFNVTLKKAGYQWITARDTQAPGMDGTQTNILVKAASASTMTVGGFPMTTSAGVAGKVTVTLKDAYGNVVTDYTGTVRLTSSDAQAVLPANYTFTAADTGTHTFSVTLKTAGTRSITVADTTQAGLAGTQDGITVNAGAASQFVISAPSSVKTGVAFSLTLTVKDAYGNVVTGYTGTVRFTSTDTTATLPANYTFTAANQGVHTFTGVILRKKGKQKITITDTLNSSLIAIIVKNVLS